MIGLPAAKGQDSPLHLGIVPDQDQLGYTPDPVCVSGSEFRKKLRFGLQAHRSVSPSRTQISD